MQRTIRSIMRDAVVSGVVLGGVMLPASYADPPIPTIASPLSEDLGTGFPITELIRSGRCRMMMVGDSISNRGTNGDSDFDRTSIYWGILRTWQPDQWRGLVVPTINEFPNIVIKHPAISDALSTIRNMQRNDPANYIYFNNYQRIATSPALDVLFTKGDVPDNTRLISIELQDGDVWAGNRWFDGPLDATFVYYRVAESMRSIKVKSEHKDLQDASAQVVDLTGPVGIAGIQAPHLDAAVANPIFKLVAAPGYDESANTDQFVWLTTSIVRSDLATGLVLDNFAAGGARLPDHLEDGRYLHQADIERYFAQTGAPNVFYIQLGANDRTFSAAWKSEMEELIDRYDAACQTQGGVPSFVLVGPYGTDSTITHADALDAARYLFQIARDGTPAVPEDRIAFTSLAQLLGGPIDNALLNDTIHPNKLGANALMSIVWDTITTCHGDLTGSIDPNNPAYGVPNGLVDSNDFFYFLDRFAAGDTAADLTGSANPADPSFGIPDLTLDANDFFYYLDMFARGCP